MDITISKNLDYNQYKNLNIEASIIKEKVIFTRVTIKGIRLSTKEVCRLQQDQTLLDILKKND